jgi:chemotaxis protein CheX
MDTLIIPRLIDATVDVFTTMLGSRLETLEPVVGIPPPRAFVVSTIGFAGVINGLVTFGCSSGAAHEITGSLLGLDPRDVHGELADAIGEMTNMIAGSFRNRMAVGTGAWALTTPFSTIGHDFSTVYATGATRVLCPFRMGLHDLFVELVLQPEARRPVGRGVYASSTARG